MGWGEYSNTVEITEKMRDMGGIILSTFHEL